MPKSFHSIYLRCQKYVPEKDLCSSHEVLSTVMTDFEGRSISTSKFVIDDPRTRYAGLKPSDFALENQLIVGVEKKPAFCSLQRAEIEREIERVNRISFEPAKSE